MFKIGTQFVKKGIRNEIYTIEDIYTTVNSAGEIVKTVYVASSLFCGQKVFDYEVPAATIARGII